MSDLEDIIARHQHYLERYKTGQYNKFAPFLSRLEDALIKRLSRQNTFNSQRRIKAVLNAIYDDTFIQLSDFTKEFDQELIELGVAEADFAAQTLIKEGLDLSGTPSITQISAAVRARPFNSKLLREELSLFSREQAKYIRNVVAMGFAEGRTNQQIIQDVVGSKDLNFKDGALQPTRTAASRMVRTAIQHSASVAKQELYAANDDLFTSYEWVSTLDSRTSMTCKARDGIVYKVGKGPLPPAHPNCVLGGTLITSALGVSTIFKRVYKGEVITINTVAGNKLTVTPNHPILTSKGWLAAKLLNVGDKCFTQTKAQGVGSVYGDNDSPFISAEDLFESFSASGNVLTSKVVVSSPDFHGDAINNEVAEVSTASNLSSVFNAGVVEHFSKCNLYVRYIRALPSLKRFVSFDDLGFRDNPACSGFIGSLNKLFPIACASVIHSCLLLFRPVPNVSSRFSEDSLNRTWTDAEDLSDSPNAYAGGVFSDDIASVEVSYFSGHVYNLQTVDHCYSANGIVTHNCRSTTVPVFDEDIVTVDGVKRSRAGGKRPAAGSGERGQVSGNLSYNDWLKRQSKQFQIDALGKAKAELFRKGGLSVDKFVDRLDKPLTLEQLKATYPTAWEKAKL